MDTQTSTSQNMGQSAFFYYNPESAADHRQHGHFSPHPQAVPDAGMYQYQQQWMHHHNMMYGQTPMAYPQVPSSSARPSKAVATPRPMPQRPAFLYQQDMQALALDTECATDVNILPSTPALSMSGSAASSPPSTCGILPTPVTSSYMGFEGIEGVKEGCQGDVKSEILAGGDFTRCDTPPLTPVFVHPPSVTASQASDLLSINSCPSLSPSPSPVSQQVAVDTKTDFCDPRNLFVDAKSIGSFTSVPDFPTLPTLCSGDDEEHKLILGGDLDFSKPDLHVKSFDPANALLTGLPNFDSFSDLDSENEFITDLTRFSPTENTHYIGDKRQRLELITFDEEEFLSEDSFDDFSDGDLASPNLLTPPESRRSSEDESAKMRAPKKRVSPKKQPKVDQDSEGEVQLTKDEAASEPADMNEDASAENNAHADDSVANSNNPSTPASSQATARRGRKQSLTDDPSKTFVCDICSRRFRRQEHLKRHHRSLHTHDKPFECNECGKKFSRSDNLSQHARTHGSGAIVMGVLEEGEYPPAGSASPLENADTGVLGAVLFEAAAAAANASSSSGSSRDSSSPTPPSDDGKPAKKRKRED